MQLTAEASQLGCEPSGTPSGMCCTGPVFGFVSNRFEHVYTGPTLLPMKVFKIQYFHKRPELASTLLAHPANKVCEKVDSNIAQTFRK